MILKQKIIKREDLRENPDVYYLFGDNLVGKGFGGQAAEMRGEPNAIGIPTKKTPTKKDSAYFTDEEYDQNIKILDEAFDKVEEVLKTGALLVVPTDRIGGGLARMQYTAPLTHQYLVERLLRLESDYVL